MLKKSRLLLLLLWYTLVEHELIKLCDTNDLSVKIKIHDQERISTSLQRAYIFLKEGASFTIPDKYWQELTKIREIRNRIVHEDGKIKSYPLKPIDGRKTITVNISEDDEEHVIHLDINKSLYDYLYQNTIIDFEGVLTYISPNFDYSLRLVGVGRALFSTIYEGLGIKIS